MDYFFGTELPEFTAWLKDNNLLPNEGAKLSVEGLLKERDYWRDKYYALLEEHNNLIKDTYLKS
jgi:hypothetical protein